MLKICVGSLSMPLLNNTPHSINFSIKGLRKGAALRGFRVCNVFAHAYAFTAPATALITWRCAKTKTRIVGRSEIIEAAQSSTQSVEVWAMNAYRPTGSVRRSELPSVKTRGIKKLFQLPIKVKRPIVASIGRASGNMTRQKS